MKGPALQGQCGLRARRRGVGWALGLGLLVLGGCADVTPRSPPGRGGDGTAPVFPPAPKDSLPCKLGLVAELPVRERNNNLFVDALVNGQNVQMLFDTGAEFTTLMPDVAKRLGLRRENFAAGKLGGIGGYQDSANFMADSFRLGGLHASDFDFFVADVGVHDGLIGTDLLFKYDVDIDLADSTIRLFTPEHDCSDPSAFLNGTLHTVNLEATVRPGVPVSWDTLAKVKIHVTIGGQLLVAQIDTGAPYDILFASGAAKLKLSAQDLAGDRRGVVRGIGSAALPAVVHDFPMVGIGDISLPDVAVHVVNSAAGPAGPDMLIGLQTLKRVHVWISHSSGKLILQYPPLRSPPLAGL